MELEEVIKCRGYYKELSDSLSNIERWVEYSHLMTKLYDWQKAWMEVIPEDRKKFDKHKVSLPSSIVERDYSSVFTNQRSYDPSKSEAENDKEYEREQLLLSILRCEDETRQYKSPTEKIIWLETEAYNVVSGPKYYGDELGSLKKDYIHLLNLKVKYYQGTWPPEEPDDEPKVNSSEYPLTQEQINAYNRVADLIGKEKYWVGSLSNFVYVIDQLHLNGYIRANEFDEAFAESFSHKPKGAAKPKKLTAEKIKTRRRNMKSRGSQYMQEEGIEKTMKKII